MNLYGVINVKGNLVQFVDMNNKIETMNWLSEEEFDQLRYESKPLEAPIVTISDH